MYNPRFIGSISLAAVFVLFVSCYTPARDCSNFKTGTFKSEVVIHDKLVISYFKRFKNLQIETYNNKTDSASVRWINNCELIFKTINPKNRIEKKDVHLKILTTTDSSYTFEYSYVGQTQKQKGVAFIVD